MTRFLAPIPLLIAASFALGDDLLAVPSGQAVSLIDVIQNEPGPDGMAVRFRFLAPAIARDGGTVTADVADADMQFLCDAYALDRIANTGPQPQQIIISLLDRPVPFGETVPDATQFMQSYSIVDGACAWDVF